MKKIITVIFAAVALGAAAKAPADTTVYFTVEPPMSCVNCENKIKTNLRYEKGVKAIEASAEKGTVAVTFNPAKTNVDRIVLAFGKVGYKAQSAAPMNTSGKKCCGNCHKQ